MTHFAIPEDDFPDSDDESTFLESDPVSSLRDMLLTDGIKPLGLALVPQEFSFGLVIYRLPLLKSRNELDSYVSREAVPADVLEKEKSIYRAQMESSGKPANVIDKIVEGKLGSYYSQVVLPDQASIRDPKMSVKDVLGAASKALGAPLTVTRFARLKVGETL